MSLSDEIYRKNKENPYYHMDLNTEQTDQMVKPVYIAVFNRHGPTKQQQVWPDPIPFAFVPANFDKSEN